MPRSVRQLVLASLLGDGGFRCGLHLGLWCGRLLDLHWLSERGLFFFATGCCCLCCGGSTRVGSCDLASGRSMLTRRCGLLACGIAFPRCGGLLSCSFAHGTHVSSGCTVLVAPH